MSKDPLDLESRKKIYEIIRHNPGLHYRELERKSGFMSGTIEYHLNYLENEDLIIGISESGYTRYFIKDARLTSHEKRIISFLRQELPRGIILYLIQHDEVHQGEIAKHFSVTPVSISYHLKRLEKNEIVTGKKIGRKKFYSVIEPDKVVVLLIIFRQSFVDVLVDSFLQFWHSNNKK